MAIFGNGKTTVAKATFAERLSSVKAMFQTAHNQASALNDEMQKEIETKQAQIESIALIDKAKKQKKSMAVAYKEALEFIQNNPVKDYIEGEDRVLRGYKMQFVSRDGRYDCVDMDIVKTDKESGIRPVNILTIKWLIYNGVKYIVE